MWDLERNMVRPWESSITGCLFAGVDVAPQHARTSSCRKSSDCCSMNVLMCLPTTGMCRLYVSRAGKTRIAADEDGKSST